MIIDNNKEHLPIPWLPDDEYQQAKADLAREIEKVFALFRLHGLDIFIPGAVEVIVRLAEDFSLKVRGMNKEINLENIQNRKGGKSENAGV